MLHLDQSPSILEIIKQNFHEPLSSLALKNHETVTQEDVDDMVIEFDDESDNELEMEFEVDPITQKLINAYPFWSNKEKKIKEIEVKKIINTKSYRKAQLCVR